MAMPIKYTAQRTFRFDKVTDDRLVELAKRLNVEVAVVGRALVELGVLSAIVQEALKGYLQGKND